MYLKKHPIKNMFQILNSEPNNITMD